MQAMDVSFTSGDSKVTGKLFPATFGDGDRPGVAIIGPMTFQKEQAPLLYAQQFAQAGFTALVFDPRYRGDSGGEPRCYENPFDKAEDLQAAVDFLATQEGVNPDAMYILGICMGSSTAIHAAVESPRVRAVATIAGHYRDELSDLAWLGSKEAVQARLERGQAALNAYQTEGTVDYVPAVDPTRTDVGMPGEQVWSWYQLWADRGLWENRYAVMSDAALLTYTGLPYAAKLAKPFLMIHGEQCAVPMAARRHFSVVPTADKQLVWDDSVRHLQYYDDPSVVERTSLTVIDWFSRHLMQAT
jgi:fermentation-respiration switch protein FrsA (DUF1100 family)